MITNKIILLVTAVLIVRYSDALTCRTPIVNYGQCHDGVKERTETYFVPKDGHRCQNKTRISYVHCKDNHKKDFCKCSAIGDPHYQTYDGQTIHYFGDCQYLLTKYGKHNEKCSFEVITQNEAKDGHSKLTCTKAVYIHMFGSEFKMGHNKGLQVDGVHKNIPYENGVDVRIFLSGKMLQFVAPRCGVNVAFDGNCNLYVEVSRKYGGQMTGICGDCNGIKDDFRTRNGKDVSNKPNKFNLIGDSYAIKVKGKHCNRAPNLDLANICKGEWRRKISDQNQCGALLARSGPFIQCGNGAKISMRDFYEDCKIDVCANVNSVENMHNARCKILEGVAEICSEAGYPGIHWRTLLNCPLKCHANQHFSTKARPCPRTCENHFYGTKDPCYHLPEREACECNEGYIRDGALCVKPADCKCIDVCVDRMASSKCELWKKHGKCKKFPSLMNSMCAKTCNFCKVKTCTVLAHDCQDELNTWKCIQFRDEGRCSEDFYKAICGLTCNYAKCACQKDRTIIGPCHRIERIQTITHYHYVRDSHGRCVKRVTQRTRVCNCPFYYKSHRGHCNFCTGRITVTIRTQRKINGRCVRRTRQTYIPCSRCPLHRRIVRKCLNNNYIVQTTTFYKRVGCYRCRFVRKSISIRVRCRSSVTESACNRRTCYKTRTYFNRRPVNCRCAVSVRRQSIRCCCPYKDHNLKPFCINGKIVHRRVSYRFENGRCKRYYTDRIEKPKCRTPRKRFGKCKRYRDRKFYCIAEDITYTSRVNRHCRCVTRAWRHGRTCCCKPGYTYTNCNKQMGILETVIVRYILEKKKHRFYCRRHIKRRERRIIFETRYIIKRGKCQSNCYRTDTIIKKYRHGCRIRTVFGGKQIKLCCCLPRAKTETMCVANYIVLTNTYKRKVVRHRCIDILVSRHRRYIECRHVSTHRGPCIYPGHQRLVTVEYYVPYKCRCKRQYKYHKEQCYPCPYRVIKTTVSPCNRVDCQQTVTTKFQDVDCKYKVKQYKQLCCCNIRSWIRTYCDQNTGITYTVRHWYEFNEQSRTCVERTSKTASSTICILLIKVKNGKCGADRKNYIKRTTERFVADKKTCRCIPQITVQWIICLCDSPKYSNWRCINHSLLVRDVTTYSIDLNQNQCNARTNQERRRIICPRPRPSHVVNIDRCRYAVYRYFYRIIDCKCQMKRTKEEFVRCCTESPHTTRKCVNENTVLTTYVTYKVSIDRKHCIKVISTDTSVITCKVTVKRFRTNCINRIYFRFTIYYGVRNCVCKKIRVQKVRVICRCIPGPNIKKECLGDRWLTTITYLVLINESCVPVSKYIHNNIRCPRGRVTRKPCNRKTGLVTVRVEYYVVIKCRCVRRIKYYHVKCPCFKRDRIIRPACVMKTRIITKERYMEVNGICKWVVIEKEIDYCRCRRRRSVTKCHNGNMFITTTVYYHLVLVHLKLWVRRCRKIVIQKARPVVCNKNYTYTTPCKFNRQSIIRCTYTKVNCQCRESCRVLCITACNCKQRNYCEFKCIKNRKYQICHTFTNPGTGCSKRSHKCAHSISKRVLLIKCSPPFVHEVCTACNIVRHHGIYKKCTRYFVVLSHCRCKIKSVTRLVLCRCKPSYVSKPYCRRNRWVTITTYYVVIRGRCRRRTSRCVKGIHCPRPFVTLRKLRCKDEYTLTYYRKRHCQCVKHTKVRYNPQCCMSATIKKYCRHNHWVFIEHKYVLRYSKIKMFPLIHNSPLVAYCQRVSRQWFQAVHCRRGYVVKCCDTVTRRLHIKIIKFVKVNCVCVRRVRIKHEACRKCPKKVIHKSICHHSKHNAYGYMDITITYYKVTRRNHCKKYVKHKRVICRCPKNYSRHYCKHGQMVHVTVTYNLYSRPPCEKHVYTVRQSIRCYNHGKPNPWYLVKVKRCTKPGQYTIEYYGRWVFNSANCGCRFEMKKVRKEICCKGCIRRRRCERNVLIFSRICEYPRGLKCITRITSSAVRIRCPRPYKQLIGRCRRGYQRYRLTTYRVHRCRCVRRSVIRTERCKCFPKQRRVCEGTRWKIITTTYTLVNGICYPRESISYITVYCRQIGFFKDFPINKCDFWRYYYVRIVKDCQCIDQFLFKKKLSNCCTGDVTVVTCRHNRFIVKTRHYFILVQFTCLPRTKITKTEVNCRHVVLRKIIVISRCRIKIIYYQLVYKKCTCQRKQIRVVFAEICCHHLKPYTKQVCNSRTGHIITYHYSFYLGKDGHCHKKVNISSFRIRCNRRECHTSVYPCINHTQLIKLYCLRRVHCRCVMKLIHQSYQCCPKHHFQWKVVGQCIGCFRSITYYAYRMDKLTHRCRAVVINRQRQRCCCRRGYVIRSCVNHVYHRVVTVNFELHVPTYSCKKITKEQITMIKGCERQERLVGIVGKTCNKDTGLGTVTYEYIHAENCICKLTRQVKPVICLCQVAYPPKETTHCKHNNVIVKETYIADCRGVVVKYDVTIKETPITNCNKIVIEKTPCFNEKDGFAISILYVSKIQYKTENCKCYRRVIEKKKEHCRCRESWVERKCHVSKVIITTHIYYIHHGVCKESVKVVIRNIPCPSHPRVTRTHCKHNKYTIITEIFYHYRCRCLSRISKRRCDCICPKKSVVYRCTRNYKIEIITTTWKKINCRCVKHVIVTERIPRCPNYIKVSIGSCVRKDDKGYQTITTRTAVRLPRICRCKITEVTKNVICWCDSKPTYRKHCENNNILVHETWKNILSTQRNDCVLVKVNSRSTMIVPPKTVITYHCNKKTRRETETIVSYTITNCRPVRHVKVHVYDCNCTKKWKLIKRGVCSGPPRCLRADIYVRQVLRGRHCIKIREIVYVKCCCHPSLKVYKYCKRNQLHTVTTTFTLHRKYCVPHVKHTVQLIYCTKILIIKKGKCIRGFRIIRHLGYVVRRCKCVLIEIRRYRCRCRCRRSRVSYQCDRRRRVQIKTVISFVLVGCKCHARRHVTEQRIVCPKYRIIVPKCLRVKGKNYYIITTVRINHYINRRCRCQARKIVSIRICKCIRNERRTKTCNSKRHIIKEKIVFTVLSFNRCITKVYYNIFQIKCRPRRWVLKGDSGCLPGRHYGQRILTYTRRIAIGCRCVEQQKVRKCDCRCTGPSLVSTCHGNRIKHIYYNYRMKRCRCVRTVRVRWENIICRSLRPYIIPCRKVAKGVYKEYTVYRHRFVLRCRCKIRLSRVGRICRCRRGFITKRCIRRSNTYVFTRVWWDLFADGCKRRSKTTTMLKPCNLIPDCHVVSACRKGSQTQRYECIEGYRENCECQRQIVRYTHRCECKPRVITRGKCNRRTCFREIITTTFNLIVLRNNRKKCVPSSKVRFERCCCKLRPVTTVQCIRNKLIATTVSYHFNKRTKHCDRISTQIDKTPACRPARVEHRGKCNRRICIRPIRVHTRTLLHCQCISHRFVIRQICCCKKDYKIRVCIRGNIFKTTTYKHILIHHHCKTITTDKFRRPKCPPNTVRYLPCRLATRTQIEETTTYYLSNCICHKRITRRDVICACPPPRSERRCLTKRGIIQITYITYTLNPRQHSCSEHRRISLIKINCNSKSTIYYKSCRVLYRHGHYRIAITRWDVRVGCICYHRSYRHFILCYCPKPYRFEVCENNIKVTKEVYYVKVKSHDRVHDYVCEKRIRIVRRIIIDCIRSQIIKGQCVNGKAIYTLIYYQLINCQCIRRTKVYLVICACDAPRLIRKRCIDDVRKERVIRYNKLYCDKKSIPTCRCVSFDRVRVRNIRCRKPYFKEMKCKRNRKRIIAIHFVPRRCKCHKVKYTTTLYCDQWCYDMPHCAQIKKLGLCHRPIYYQFECRKTCGYCKKCPKDHIVNHGKCTCIHVGGLRLCTRRSTIERYVVINRRCVKRTRVHRTLCNCVNKYPLKRCEQLKNDGRCHERGVMKNCEYTCNPNCGVRCHGRIKRRKCVNRRKHGGTYLITIIKFKTCAGQCVVKILKMYRGRCSVCDNLRRREVTPCIGHVRYVVTYYVVRIRGRCFNRVIRTPYSCKNCCPSTETRIGNCHGGFRTVVTIFWANINHCCKKQSFTNIYPCNKRCLDVVTTRSKCVRNKRLQFRLWKSGPKCTTHSAYDVVSCVPVKI